MLAALEQFKANLERTRNLNGLAHSLETKTTAVLDVSDVYRAVVVSTVSALDHFIHELTRKGMLEVAMGVRLPTEAYLRFSVSLKIASIMLFTQQGQSDAIAALDNEIRERHGWLSFQAPDKIADAIRHFSPTKKLWEKIGADLGVPAKAIVSVIVDRRNKIAHEADMDPTVPGARWPISFEIAAETIDNVERIGSAVFRVAV